MNSISWAGHRDQQRNHEPPCRVLEGRAEMRVSHVRSPRKMKRWVRNDTAKSAIASPTIDPTR